MRKKGFTLIELLVVIAIIGILATIVLVAVGGARTQARAAKTTGDMNQIMMAMELYYAENTAYYAAVGDCGTDTNLAASVGGALCYGNGALKPHIASIPTPAGSYAYTATALAAGGYKITATGFAAGEGDFVCENGSCYCTVANKCKK